MEGTASSPQVLEAHLKDQLQSSLEESKDK